MVLLLWKKADDIRQQVDGALSTIGPHGEKCVLSSFSILITVIYNEEKDLHTCIAYL